MLLQDRFYRCLAAATGHMVVDFPVEEDDDRLAVAWGSELVRVRPALLRKKKQCTK